jgi:hypothetical protein
MRFRRAFRKEILTASEIERRLYGAPLTEMNKHTPPPSGGALEAKEILNNLLHRKETVMPDIQTALKSAIDAWEPTPTGQQLKEKLMTKTPFAIQNNVTRVTFDYIKLHPGTTAAAASRDLTKHGFKESSVTALMAQFVRAGLATRDNNHGYRVTVDEYTPMKASAKYTKKDAVKAKPAPKAREPQNDGIAALHPEATSKRVVNTIVFGKPPEEVVKHMNVIQARELYDYLKKMFGG